MFKWLIVILCCVTLIKTEREKRTLDFVIRSFADAFGYDVQKRPSVLPVAPTPAQTQPRKASPTFFPPPLQPLPPGPGLINQITTKKPKVAVPAKPLPAPKAPPTTKTPTPSKAPPPAPRAAPPPITAPPLLTENVRKTFNIAFNWNRDVQTAPTTPMTPTPPKNPLPPPSKNPPPPPPKNSPTKQTSPSPSSTPNTSSHKKPQLAVDYNDYYDTKEKYQELEPSYDYGVNSYRGNEPEENNYEDSKQRFKESIRSFWEGSPWLQNHGYKYLTTPSEENSDNLENTKYEEYPIIHQDDNVEESKQEILKCTTELPVPQQIINKIKEEEKKRKIHTTTKKLTTKKPTRIKTTTEEPIEFREGDVVIEPSFSGVLNVPLHELYSGRKALPWPIPFDADHASSENKEIINRSDFVFKYQPDVYTPEQVYEPPEPKPVDYTKLEKLTQFDEKDADLSKNAKIQTRQSGTKYTYVIPYGDTQIY